MKAPYTEDLYISNHDSMPITVDFGTAVTTCVGGGGGSTSGVFVLEPLTLTVNPEEMTQVGA